MSALLTRPGNTCWELVRMDLQQRASLYPSLASVSIRWWIELSRACLLRFWCVSSSGVGVLGTWINARMLRSDMPL